MAFAASPSEQSPLGEMNTTPLIDVMLVLLIMFIITIPVATNVVDVALPGKEHPGLIVMRNENSVSVTPGGAITWNGAPLGEAQLHAALKASLTIKPEPLLKYEPDVQAPYGASARVLRTIKQSGVSAFGFVGNERYGEFGKAPQPR